MTCVSLKASVCRPMLNQRGQVLRSIVSNRGGYTGNDATMGKRGIFFSEAESSSVLQSTTTHKREVGGDDTYPIVSREKKEKKRDRQASQVVESAASKL